MFERLEEEYDVANDAFAELQADTAALQALQPQPTLEFAKENVGHLHAELCMTKSQACLCRRLCCNCTLQHSVTQRPITKQMAITARPENGRLNQEHPQNCNTVCAICQKVLSVLGLANQHSDGRCWVQVSRALAVATGRHRASAWREGNSTSGSATTRRMRQPSLRASHPRALLCAALWHRCTLHVRRD